MAVLKRKFNTDAEKGAYEEKIRISFIKNRGNEQATAFDVGAPIDDVRTVCNQYLSKAKQGKVSPTDTLLHYLELGHVQRTSSLQNVLEEARQAASRPFSQCCKAPASVSSYMKEKGVDDIPFYTCTACDELCDVFFKFDNKAMGTMLGALDLMRKEDAQLLNFISKLHLSQSPEDMKPTGGNPEFTFTDESGKKTKRVVSKEVVADADKLTPVEREKLRKDLELRIVSDVSFEKKK